MVTSRTAPRTGRKGKAPAVNSDSISRERVMKVALHKFLQHGYAGTSMKALAQELGVSAPAIYWYFPSKDDLYVSVLDASMKDFLAHVHDSITDEEPVTKLGQIVRAHVTWQLQQLGAARAFDLTMTYKGESHDLPSERLEPVFKMQRAYVQEVAEVLQRGKDRGVMRVDDVRTASFAIITLCDYVFTWFDPQGEMSVAAVANRYESLVRNMVGASAYANSLEVV
ncbi:TetR/AcrR family transcriptional regulator [Paenarthrobacter aromaticivorans]|uniref:TetR/AcrR family transcriptional regulator n=1 Tax=Paenarthrobacter aromaticivorans TaxID=2849150 RepID=A0ABS6I7V4_9MICC|nr:TetR/AcrR family transcriptional regulator [Paenarthrobacter sp. MMS21-TAE1-1]MBU8867791.1 TetR/AcrR family transcriptional regulator [Paenarthrobacter sp. MMS21-TAE1-1]